VLIVFKYYLKYIKYIFKIVLSILKVYLLKVYLVQFKYMTVYVLMCMQIIIIIKLYFYCILSKFEIYSKYINN